MPCTECGTSLDRTASDPHVCDRERVLDFRLFQLHDEIAAFDAQLAEWLRTAADASRRGSRSATGAD